MASVDFSSDPRWLVLCCGNGSGHIHNVKLHQAWLVLALVTTFALSTIPVFIEATQAPWVAVLAMVLATAGVEMVSSA